jgi:RNA polymerase sigma-70 factor (ECF subfamily)
MSQDLPELLQQILGGQEAALVVLHERYARLVFSVAYRVLGDALAAEEVTQDTFMRLWRRSEAYDAAKGAFVPWLLTIARRLAIDAFRKQQRDPLRDPVYPNGHSEGWEQVLGEGVDSELQHSMKALVWDLPAEQRAAIELAYFHGMTHSQIADYLGEPLGTIKTRLRLGMQKLREAWFAGQPTDPRGDIST